MAEEPTENKESAKPEHPIVSPIQRRQPNIPRIQGMVEIHNHSRPKLPPLIDAAATFFFILLIVVASGLMQNLTGIEGVFASISAGCLFGVFAILLVEHIQSNQKETHIQSTGDIPPEVKEMLKQIAEHQ